MPSVGLYAISTAEFPEEISDLTTEFEKSAPTKLSMDKMTEEIAIVLLNDVDPYNNTSSIPYKMLFGNSTSLRYDYPEIGGFMPTSEVASIIEWIKQHDIETIEGFSKIYDSISDDTKNHLEEIGAIGKDDLHLWYVKPLVNFYFSVNQNKNSILFCAE